MLLFQARTRCLLTNARRSELFKEVDPACQLCGKGMENLQHILTECDALRTPGNDETTGNQKASVACLSSETETTSTEQLNRVQCCLVKWEQLKKG